MAFKVVFCPKCVFCEVRNLRLVSANRDKYGNADRNCREIKTLVCHRYPTKQVVTELHWCGEGKKL